MQHSQWFGGRLFANSVTMWLLGSIAFLQSTSVGQNPPSAAPPTSLPSDEGPNIDSVDNAHAPTAHDAEVTRLIDQWERLLKDSQFATLSARVRRTRTDRDIAAVGAEPVIIYDDFVRAQAVMKRGANWLLVWEGAKEQPGDQDKPAMKLEHVYGKVREDIWDVKQQKYRTTRYTAPTAWGPIDSPYENACMVGTYLQTWLDGGGETPSLIAAMRSAEALVDPIEISGKQCRVLRLARPRPSGGFAVEYEFAIDSEGRLTRWRTTQTSINEDKEIIITQTRDLDFQFFAEAPPDATPPATTVPAGARSP